MVKNHSAVSLEAGDDADRIIDAILGRPAKEPMPRAGHARGFLVLDEDLRFLQRALEGANFLVSTADEGLSGASTRKRMLGHRLLVTRNTRDFLGDAPVYDFGIMGLEALPALDPHPEFEQNETARLISNAYCTFALRAERGAYVLMLRPDGNHRFERLE